jgi:hypothetical protein
VKLPKIVALISALEIAIFRERKLIVKEEDELYKGVVLWVLKGKVKKRRAHKIILE